MEKVWAEFRIAVPFIVSLPYIMVPFTSKKNQDGVTVITVVGVSVALMSELVAVCWPGRVVDDTEFETLEFIVALPATIGFTTGHIVV
jgi:hypothetical protein